MFPYLFVAGVLYLLYRYYPRPTTGPAVVDLDADNGGGGQPINPPSGGGGDVTPPPSQPAAPTATWQPIPEGQQLQPGNTFRATAPPQGFLVMAMIPSHLSGAGFTNVQIYKPGDAYPNDWPDSGGQALRIQAALPAGAQPQTFNLDGVQVWQQVVTQTAGQVVDEVARRVVHAVRHPEEIVQAVQDMNLRRRYPHPTGNGVYDGLVPRR